MPKTLRNLLTKTFFLLPILLFVLSLNYSIDPSKLFQNGEYEKGIALLLLDGQNVTGTGNFDDRLLQRDYIDDLQERKDIIVLGSSRSMYIRSNLFTGQSFFNNSVSMATLNDHIAIYGMYRKRKILPKKIIICLDEWLFSEKKGTDNWRTLQKEYVVTVKLFLTTKDKEGIGSGKFYKLKKYFQIFSPQYFHTSFFDAIKGNKYKYYPTNKPLLEKGASKLFDGSLVYNDAVRQRTVQQTNAIAIGAKTKEASNDNSGFLSLEVKEKFESFINFMLSDRIEVVFFLPPSHPKLFETDSYAKEIEMYVKTFAKSKNIQILGSYNPLQTNVNEEDFFDGGHLRDSGIHKLFLQQKEGEAFSVAH